MKETKELFTCDHSAGERCGKIAKWRCHCGEDMCEEHAEEVTVYTHLDDRKKYIRMCYWCALNIKKLEGKRLFQ